MTSLLPLSRLFGEGQKYGLEGKLIHKSRILFILKAAVYVSRAKVLLQARSGEHGMTDILSTQGWGSGILQPWGEGAWETIGGLSGEYGNWLLKRGPHSQSASKSHGKQGGEIAKALIGTSEG